MKDILPYNDELPYHLGRRILMILKSYYREIDRKMDPVWQNMKFTLSPTFSNYVN